MNGNLEMIIIIGAIILIVVFFLTREFWCWYWKINQRISLMEEQNKLLMLFLKDEKKNLSDQIVPDETDELDKRFKENYNQIEIDPDFPDGKLFYILYVKEKAALYDEKNESSKIINDIFEGSKVYLLSRDEGWCFVKTIDGRKGWMKEKYLVSRGIWKNI